MKTLDFWYEFASTYSYLAAMRIEEAAAARNVRLRWRVFLLGPIFRAQGWENSPFNILEAKGRNMWRDLARLSAAQGLAFSPPDPFPQNSMLAARVAMALGHGAEIAPFSRAVFDAEFARGRQISDPDVIGEILETLGLDAPATLDAAQGDGNKQALRAQTEDAVAHGIYGAPSFVSADGELFWGNDRLDRALDWAADAGNAGDNAGNTGGDGNE